MDPAPYSYHPTDPVLILTLDSFHKVKGGILNYDEKLSIFSTAIDEKNKIFLAGTRKNVFKLLKNGEVHWHECELERGDNDNLVAGKDFRSDAPDARYLPGMERYEGDLFEGIGESERDVLVRTNHHFLILSALYGILMPFEPIQFYSCQFGDRNVCFDLWTKQEGITAVLVDYIRKYNISRIFDFTACDITAYHDCINWGMVTGETGATVLHAYHKKTTSDKALRYFGRFIRDKMLPLPSADLMNISAGAVLDDIEFVSKPRVLNTKISDEERFRALIAKGEHGSIEFKSSTLWSARYTNEEIESSREKDIRKYGRNTSKIIIAKTIAGFLNTQGGNLVIGIKENKNGNSDEIVGIEGEYNKLQDPCPDGYRRMIVDDIIKYYFSSEIFNNFSKYLSISFPVYENKTLCWLQMVKSDVPVYINVLREDLFFIRVDAETRQITGKPLGDYLLKRFR
jgi:hypothetical protein